MICKLHEGQPHLFTCEALSTTEEKCAFAVCECTFTEFGLP
jgi:hypothetical protein